jgi:hypothetical protein
MCINIPGYYKCACPKGYHGDGRTDGDGCSADPDALAIKIPIGKYIYLLFYSSNAWWPNNLFTKYV